MYENSVFLIKAQVKDYKADQAYIPPSLQKCSGSVFFVQTSFEDSSETHTFLVTAAHVVENAVRITIEIPHVDSQFTATVKYIDPGFDLAILEVKQKNFYNYITPLPLLNEFDVNDIGRPIKLVGFPAGGNQMAMTEGHISRIDMQQYINDVLVHPAIQVDAAMNPGNSGGPALADGKVMGVCIQSFDGEGMQNTNFIVPSTVLRNFLQQSLLPESKRGYPYFPLLTQNLKNPFLREHVGLSEEQTGLLVKQSENCSEFHEGDVLTHIEGKPISNKGTADYRGIPLLFKAILSEKKLGDVLHFDIIRDRKPITIDYTLSHTFKESHRIRTGQGSSLPRFYIASGLIFQSLSLDLLRSDVKEGEKTKFRLGNATKIGFKTKTDTQKEVILLAEILETELTDGYEDYAGEFILLSANDVSIGSMEQLIEAVETNKEDTHVFKLFNDSKKIPNVIVVPNLEKDPQAKNDLLQQFSIATDADRSDDLKLKNESKKAASLSQFIRFSIHNNKPSGEEKNTNQQHNEDESDQVINFVKLGT